MEPSVAEKFAARDALLATHPRILETRHQVVLGDARTMPGVEPGSIHLVATSPPYWNLKEYDGRAGEDQLGHVADYARFLDNLDRVWKRCFEVLAPGGRLCVIVGDVCLPRRQHGRHVVVPLHADISVRCRALGFDYLTPIFWHKIANAVTEVEGSGAFLGKPYEPNAIIKNDTEYVLMFRKPGGYRRPTLEQRVLSLIDKQDHARWFRSVWTDIRGASTRDGHPAPFPTELAYRLIRMFSFVGDTVLDPFLGSGTTTEAAILASRNSVGFEIEPTYFAQVRRRFAQLRADATVEFDAD
jgi:site-specific DNA-methyltransferase (adenine-specific)